MKCYLVGGAVRDELLGRPVQDRDIVVLDANEETFMHRFPGAIKVGGRACVYIVNGVEYTLSPARSIREDLGTRDLTINALARDDTGLIIAHPRALNDLHEGVLRPVALENFLEDPLRAVRAARFAAWFPEFAVHPDLVQAMERIGRDNLLASVAAERVGSEVLKAGRGPRPGRFLDLLARTGLLDPWFEELKPAGTVPAGPAPFHTGSLLAHIAAVMDRLAPDPMLVWMALCHDLGKAGTDPAQWPRHHHHEHIGAPMAETMGKRLRLSSKHIRMGVLAARYHMIAGMYHTLRPGTRVDLMDGLSRDEATVTALFRLVRADGGEDHLNRALRDLATIKAVRLPEKYRNQGPRSGEMLRLLRCQAVKKARVKG
jgi:tRNA nucleotidyltransferase (CCA-adding enzyme)